MPTNIAGPAAISIHESVTVKENGKQVKHIDDWIHPSDLETIMKAHPRSSFKLKIMACFSGRFIDDLKGAVPNLELIETSSASNEVTFGEKKRHKASDGTVTTNPTDKSLLTKLGTPTFDWSGGGGNGIQYSSCALKTALGAANFTVIARREITY